MGRLVIATLLGLCLAACQSLWTRVDAKNAAYTDDRYTVELPQGWVRAKAGQIVFVTRDGVGVQRVTIEFREHDEAFETTEQTSSADMLPSELAIRYLAEIRAADENGLPSLEILSNRPITIDDRLGFALHLRFLNRSGLRYERLVSGIATQQGLFLIGFQAPTLHFFERDRGVFDQVVESFRPL